MLSIGEVAAATGASVSAIRYYDEIGLVAEAARVGGKRRFDSGVVRQIRFIRAAQRAGFTLDEVGGLLRNSDDWRILLDTKLDELIDQRRRLTALIETLRSIRQCDCGDVAGCDRMDADFG